MTSRKKEEEPVKDNYILIKISWDKFLLLPYSDGVKVTEALKNAEFFNHSYSGEDSIVPLKMDDISITVLSREEYVKTKAKSLLNPPSEE